MIVWTILQVQPNQINKNKFDLNFHYFSLMLLGEKAFQRITGIYHRHVNFKRKKGFWLYKKKEDPPFKMKNSKPNWLKLTVLSWIRWYNLLLKLICSRDWCPFKTNFNTFCIKYVMGSFVIYFKLVKNTFQRHR